MKKIKVTEYQREWVNSFEKFEGCPHIHMMTLLLKLKIITLDDFVKIRSSIVDHVIVWRELLRIKKRRKSFIEDRNSHYDSRPPKRLKSDSKYR